MARKRKRKSSKKGLSQPLSAKVKRSKPRKRKRGFMSEVFTPGNAMEAGKSTFSGLVGGGIGYGVDALGAAKIENELGRGAIHLGVSFVSGALLGMRNVGAGIAGAYSYSTLERLRVRGMQEDFQKTKYTDEEILNRYPDAMSEDGTPLYLAEDEDGNQEYLTLDELKENFDLSQNMQARLYPGYVNTSQF